MIHPFSEAELLTLDTQKVSKRERRRILARRHRPLPDPCWTYVPGEDPDWRLKGGGVQGWQETLESTVADGTQISNTVTETIVVPDFNIPAYYMAGGRTFRIWAYGVNSNVVTTPGTLIFAIRWGGVSGTVLCQSAAIVLDVTLRTNALWVLMAYITCRSAGSSGSFLSGGFASIVNQKGSVAVASNTEFNSWVSMLGSAGTPIASGSAAVSVNTTIANLLSVTAKFSVNTSATNLTAQQRTIEVLN